MVPSVSIVIPLYSKAPYITLALTSVITQTFQDFEVIVVDDGSPYDGAAVARWFGDSRIRLIQQENQGFRRRRIGDCGGLGGVSCVSGCGRWVVARLS